MLHASAPRFDVTVNLDKFLVFVEQGHRPRLVPKTEKFSEL